METKKEQQDNNQLAQASNPPRTTSTSTSTSSASSMSWLNFQTIHLIVEVVAICGLSYFFNKKVNSLTKQIEDLHSRLEDQEKILQNHEDVLKKIIANYRQPQIISSPPPASHIVSNSNSNCVGGVCAIPQPQAQPQPQPQARPQPQRPRQQEILPTITRIETPVAENENVQQKDPPVSFGETLDDELQEELSELSRTEKKEK
jgi:hypothetical protein